MKLGNMLRKARLEKGLTQTQIADRLAISPAYYNRIEAGKVKPPSWYLIEKLAIILNCDKDDLIKLAEAARIEYKQKQLNKERKSLKVESYPETFPFRLIPVLNSISAGKLIDYTDLEYPAGWAEEFEPCPSEITDPQAFSLDVEGDSMQPKVSAGDRIIISPNTKVESGEIAVIVNEEDRKTIKRVHFRENQIVLTSDNPKYQPIFWDKKDKPKILGKVVRIIKRP